MALFYVFDTEEEALAASETIEGRARELYVNEGYEVDAEGNVIGVNVGTGESDPEAQRTERYAIPQQRLDQKWIIPHPEQMPSADIERNGMLVKDYVSQDLTDAVTEEYDPSWFPPPPDLPGAP